MPRASEAGRFRADLYYRLAILRLRVPPVREREDDRLLLFAAFLDEARQALGAVGFEPSTAVHARLRQHEWPGNVRELRNYAFEAILSVDRAGRAELPRRGTLVTRVAAYEAELIREALDRHHGRIRDVIAELGTPRKTFYDKLARHGITSGQFRSKGHTFDP